MYPLGGVQAYTLLGTCSLICHVLVIAKSGRDVRIGAFKARSRPWDSEGGDPGDTRGDTSVMALVSGRTPLQEEQSGHNLRVSPE